MRHILFLFIFISFGCQTFGKSGGWLGGQKQARKGWKRIDRDWLSAKAADGQEAKAGDRAPAQSQRNNFDSIPAGQFICSDETHHSHIWNMSDSLMSFMNNYCDPAKQWKLFLPHPQYIQTLYVACCIKK